MVDGGWRAGTGEGIAHDIDAGAIRWARRKTGGTREHQGILIEHSEVHLPNLAKTNASDQRSMLTKLVRPGVEQAGSSGESAL